MHFLYFFFGSLILGMLYIHLRFNMGLSSRRTVRLACLALVLSVVVGTFLTLTFKIRGRSGAGVDVLAWYAYTGIGVLSFLLTLMAVHDLLWALTRVLRRFRPRPATVHHRAHRRLFLKQSTALGLSGGALMFSGCALYNAKKTPEVKEVVVPVAGLHPDLSGFSIVQITDIHLGSTVKGEFLETVVDRVNALSPSLVALTGDLVDGYVETLGKETLPLAALRADHGLYFVTGNHEYYFKADQWCRHLETLGFTVLNNGHRLIEKGAGRLILAGVTDLRAEHFFPDQKSDPAKALENAPDAQLKILLAHQPKSVYEAAKAGFDIQLSGHTHGGQFFPWNFIVGLDQPFLAGAYRHGGVFLHVSRGTGYWGPPMRLGSPSEITRLVLKRA